MHPPQGRTVVSGLRKDCCIYFRFCRSVIGHSDSHWFADTATETQKQQLLTMLEESPELSNNRAFLPGETAAQRRVKWDAIAVTLKSIATFQKDGKGWQLLWKDWRYRVRNRARRMNGTVGGSGLVRIEDDDQSQGRSVEDISAQLSGANAV